MRHAILVILVCLTFSASSQWNGKFTFTHIDQTDGLLHTTVKGIGQDADGYMWILSWNGLQRYDGSRFVDYPEILQHSAYGSLHDGELFVDTLADNVWVFTYDKIDKLDKSTNTFTTTTLQGYLEDQLSQSSDTFSNELRESWQIGKAGAIFRNEDHELLSAFFNPNPGQTHRNTVIIQDPVSGDYFTHSFKYVVIGDPKSHKLISSSDSLTTHPLLKQLWDRYGHTNRIRYILLDSYHTLWISTWTYNLLSYNFDTGQLKSYSLLDIARQERGAERDNNNMLVNAMYEDKQKNLWVGTDFAGLLRYDRKHDRFDYITSDEKLRDGLLYNFSIYSIFQDRDDNIWLGTDRGISVFNPYRNYFQSIHHVDGNSSSLPKYDINDITQTAQGEILVATWGGGITVFDNEWNFKRNVHFAGAPGLEQVWSFVKLDDGTVWAGAQNGYIHVYDPVLHSFRSIHPVETGFSTITQMAKDHDGNILIGLSNGKITLWDKTENKFYPYINQASDSAYISTAVLDICIDYSGRCWVTTAAGLYEYDRERHSYTHLFQPEGSSTGVAFQGIEVYNDTMLLLGAEYKGIYTFNIHTSSFSRIPVNDAHENTSVYAIKKDKVGNIWCTTNYTLIKMNADFRQQSLFQVDQSMMNASFVSSRFYELNDGRLVTHSAAELICFDPGKIGTERDAHLEVEICGFNVYEKKMFIDSFLDKHVPIVLPYNSNFISIEFSALQYTDMRQINYYYRLTGVNKTWIHSTTRQFVDYTDLPSGEYTFEVKADNGNGPTSITSFGIIINPPWWGTWWFRILFLLALGSLIYWVVRGRIHTIRKEAALQQRIAETEMMALRSQMNPHFIFNCINSIDAMIQSNDKYKATVYLNKFARLIRNVLDSSKQNKIPLSKDMETLQLYIDLELFRHQDKFTATVTTEDELLQNDYKVPPLIVQPYVENAILHGLRHKMNHPGRLSLTVTKQHETILYVIEDNGVGRKSVKVDSKKDSNGYGMQISRDRVRLFNKEEIASVQITDLEKDGVPAGTRVEVQLKIQ